MFRPIDAVNVLCVQLTRDLIAIAKFLFFLLQKAYRVTLVTWQEIVEIRCISASPGCVKMSTDEPSPVMTTLLRSFLILQFLPSNDPTPPRFPELPASDLHG